MPIYYGVVKGNMVVLPPDARLPEGSTVEIRVPDEAAILAAKEAMLAAGLITTIRMPGTPLPPHRRATPLAVEGPPASELVIQERR
jgi:hypothetical protein